MSAYQRPVIKPGSSSNVPLCPTAVYRVYCQKAVVKHSQSSGDLMVEVTAQIISPDTVTLKDGPTVQTAGLEGRFYIVFSDGINKRGEHKMVAVMEALTKLGVPLPDPSPDFETEAQNLADATAKYLVNMTWEMVVSSKREERRAPGTNEPLVDSAGNKIMGAEVVDFNSFNIVGLPKTLDEVGATVHP